MKKICLILTICLFISNQTKAYKNNFNEFDVNHSFNSEDGDIAFTEYYSTLPFRETPFPDVRGIVPITKNIAKKRNHYKFEYDSKKRLRRVSFLLGNTLRDPNHTANYFYLSSVIEFHYETNKEIRTFFDKFYQPISVRGNVFKEIYELDERNHRKSLYFEDKEGKRIENNWNIARYEWEIQLDGSVIEERYNLKGEVVPMRPGLNFFRLRLIYQHTGFLHIMQNIDEKGQLVENETGVAQDKIESMKDGRWLGWTVMDKHYQLKNGNGPLVSKGIYPSDDFGYEVGAWHEDSQGNPIASAYGFWGSKTQFDDKGNMIFRTFLDSLKNPGPHLQAGYTHLRITWDKKGLNELSRELLDKDMMPINHQKLGYATTKRSYDKKGRLIKVAFYDAKGNLVNRTDNGTAFYEYSYKDNVRTVKRYNNINQLL